jgi:hypothetical protein
MSRTSTTAGSLIGGMGRLTFRVSLQLILRGESWLQAESVYFSSEQLVSLALFPTDAV